MGTKTLALLVGTIVLVVAVVAGLAFLGPARSDSSRPTDQTVTLPLDKSEGAEDAPVLVMEYGDFQ